MDPEQTLRYAQDLAMLRAEGRQLRRRIEEQTNRPKIVLIADDEPLMRALLASTLSPETYDLREASTGNEAMGIVRSVHPELVLLDQRMPDRDGVTVCSEIKGDPELNDILVMMLTADPSIEVAARTAGADAYLTKPFSPRQLLQTVEALLNAQG
jgi:DNA-binding response OmpR family regulator